MVLGAFEKKWTNGLCFLYIICNMIVALSFGATDRTKEPFFVSDDKVLEKRYQFEDFFWTGSGDGPVTEDLFINDTETEVNVIQDSPSETWRTTTVFHTTTILFATVYPNGEDCSKRRCRSQISPVQTESTDFSLPAFPSSKVDISPTPTQKHPQTNALPDLFDKNDIEGNEASNTFSPNFRTNESAYPKTDLGILNATTVFPQVPPDEKYWILTVLRNDNYSPKLDLNLTENKLSSLYRKAFNRRQEKFLGEHDYRDRRERKISQPVKAHIFNATQKEGNDVNIVYYVTVAGKPVPAMTAATDMRLMTASEVIAELGYPILTKAEPYAKSVVPLGARVRGRTRDTWLLIGSVIAAVLLLIILAGFFALGLSKKRTKRNTAKGASNRKQVFEEEEGSTNLAFQEDADVTQAKNITKRTQRGQFKSQDSNTIEGGTGTTVKFTEEERRGSTTSSCCSGSSEASLVRLRHQQRKKEKREEREEKPKPKPRTRIRRVDSSDCSKNYKRYIQNTSRNTFDEINTEGYDDLSFSPNLTRSPTSYLSMPSVRAFPRGAKIPESMSKILEPTSIRHLDADSDSPSDHHHCTPDRYHEVDVQQVCEVKNKFVKRKAVTRHASLEGDDPGFIGPVVWNKHCQKISEAEPDSINIEEIDENVNVGRIRRRFNELLDDALSVFGSRNGSPEGSDVVPARQLDNRVHSAVVRPAGLPGEELQASRPKTTGSKRPQSSIISGPRGAWETPSCSTLPRPVSAGVFRKTSPTIDTNLIYANSALAPSDPAIPLIAAIKNELKKFEDPSCGNT